MALSIKLLPSNSPALFLQSQNQKSPNVLSILNNSNTKCLKPPWKQQLSSQTSFRFRIPYRYNHSAEDDDEDEEEEEEDYSFEEAVALFNKREYYKCHDFLESIWIKSEDPTRTLVHGILQCAVGFHHLFNQNHKGAMMELGEGVCKLRKLDFQSGPFHQFEQEISAVLQFIYQTQIEHAACSDDLCVTMDQSERSYQLLGEYGAGQVLYSLEIDTVNGMRIYIVFCPQTSSSSSSVDPPRVKLPILQATNQHLLEI
ncbi:uncharacterized protein [Euphorbia lathyris]|uniref:uncharacterized protein n=1 Tax=Euphorbia lathyris TaxID=212925 RepID=UPI00331405A0